MAVQEFGAPAFSILIGFVGIAWFMTRDTLKPRTEEFTISTLYVYPVVGCREVTVATTMLERLGSRSDRRFVIIRRDGNEIVTLRNEKRLVHITPILNDRGELSSLKASVPGESKMEKLQINKERSSKIELEHMGLSYTVAAVKDTRHWLTKFLGYESELYELKQTRMPLPNGKKFGDFYRDEDEAYLALTGQFLVQQQSTLDEIQARCQMENDEYWTQRFRPNIVVTGGKSFEEDLWNQVDSVSLHGWMAGKTIPFRISRPSVCCSSTTVSPYPMKGEKKLKEPLKTLYKLRAPRDEQFGNTPMLGVNFSYDCPPEEIEGAMINVGDQIVIKTFLNMHPLVAADCAKLYNGNR